MREDFIGIRKNLIPNTPFMQAFLKPGNILMFCVVILSLII